MPELANPLFLLVPAVFLFSAAYNWYKSLRPLKFAHCALFSALCFSALLAQLSLPLTALAAPRTAYEVKFAEFEGRTIRTITVHVKDIFEGEDIGSLYKTANSLKINTREEVVKRELLFKEGEAFSEFALHESERFLRLVPFIRNVVIVPTAVSSSEVDVAVTVQDTWTFLPTLNYSTGTGNSSLELGIVEGNLAGYGKRLELLYGEQDNRKTFQGVWDDTRVMGTFKHLLLGYFDRSDGERAVALLERPFRSLLEKRSWLLSGDYSDGVGRLYENGDERYIFHQRRSEFMARFASATGDPETAIFRYSVGWDFIEDDFTNADQDDFESIDLDPSTVLHDPALLAEDRRFSGPAFGMQKLAPQFIEMNYIDRFDRVQDYNLGSEYAGNFTLAPEIFGSRENKLLFSANSSRGLQFSPGSFLRGEVGLAGRLDMDHTENVLARAELKYYNVLGSLYAGDTFLGKHTLAANFYVDYGRNLDRDREFLLGADSSLRGYESRTFPGDKRLVLNLEDRMHLVEDFYRLISIGAAVFIDVGGATRKNFGDIFGNELYSNVGAGLRFAFPRSSGSRVLRLDVAFPLRAGPDGSDKFEPRILISGGQLFGSRLRSESFGPERANVEVGTSR